MLDEVKCCCLAIRFVESTAHLLDLGDGEVLMLARRRIVLAVVRHAHTAADVVCSSYDQLVRTAKKRLLRGSMALRLSSEL